MIIGVHRSGKPISVESPDASLVFKTYGKPLETGLVKLDLPSGPSLLFNPDTGTIVTTSASVEVSVDAVDAPVQTKQKHRAKSCFIPMSSAAGGKCVITGNTATADNAIITDEGHVYTKEGLRLLFSGGRRVARSPYPGAQSLLKSKYFSAPL